MKVYAITGLLGAGKTSACEYLRELGYPTLNLDDVSKIVLDKNTPEGKDGFAAIYKAFGSTVLDSLGNLDRTALRKRLMIHPHEKEKLELILNPRAQNYVRKIMTDWKSQNTEFAFLEGARVFESGFDKVVAGVIKVTAPEKERVKRIVKRDSMGKEEAEMLVSAQDPGMIDRFSKIEWKNDKALSALQKQIDDFIISKREK